MFGMTIRSSRRVSPSSSTGFPLLAVVSILLLSHKTDASCYDRAGKTNDDFQCPDSSNCCPGSSSLCLSNGICQDSNNHANGTLTNTGEFGGGNGDGPYMNFTGLYKVASCSNHDQTGCSLTSCSSSYIWVCNSDLTQYCCHTDKDFTQYDCCGEGNLFSLAAPIPLASFSTAASATSTIPTKQTGSTSTSSGSNTETDSIPITSLFSQSPASVTSAASAPDGTSSGATSTSTTLKLGLGLGLGLGIPLILLPILFLLWRNHRRVAKLQSQINGEHLVSPIYYQHGGAPAPETTARKPKAGELAGKPIKQDRVVSNPAELDTHPR
jgi:hypothetical protein